ncbi:hypothetical protein CHUAL_013560 [Chamberlinius hualienensis]
MPSTLAYWNIRGLAQPIRLLLTYAGEDFEDKLYETGPAPNYDKSGWFKEKFTFNLDFPNLPYYIDDKYRLTQSSTIICYLARKYNLAGTNEDERVRAQLLEAQVADLRKAFTMMCYGGDKHDELRANYAISLPDSIKSLSAFLGERNYFAGENLTYADFLAYEYLFHQLKFDPTILDGCKNLKQFFQRFEALPRLAEYIKTAPSSKYPLNNKQAKFGNI